VPILAAVAIGLALGGAAGWGSGFVFGSRTKALELRNAKKLIVGYDELYRLVSGRLTPLSQAIAADDSLGSNRFTHSRKLLELQVEATTAERATIASLERKPK
jgi:hypothetical protein